MKRILVFLILFTAPYLYAQETNSCAQYNSTWSFTPPQAQVDYTEHASVVFNGKTLYSGSHFVWGSFSGTCSYSGSYINGPNGYCNTTCAATTSAVPGESGGPYDSFVPFYTHKTTAQSNKTGFGQSNGGGANCGGTYGGATAWCVTSFGCNLSVSVSAGIGGVNGSVSISPPSNLWTATPVSDDNYCPALLSPGCVSGIPPVNNNGSAGMWYWAPYPTCMWVWHQFRNTPLLIDTDGSGFHLTSVKRGIVWDFYGNGQPVRIAWTEPGSTNGWLAIDLDNDGTIDNAGELFGDVGAHVPPPRGCNDPDCFNGFNKLMSYDLNEDGVIDNKDAVWSKLLVWIDTNHDGISQPEELHRLDDMGIHSISVKWERTSKVDQYGNGFRYKGAINLDGNPDGVHREIYDVFLKGQFEIDWERTIKNPICWDRVLQKAVSCASLGVKYP